MGARTLRSWESCGRRGAAREAGSVLEKVFPVPGLRKVTGNLSWIRAHRTGGGVGGGGAGAGGEVPSLASPSPDGGCGKLGEGTPGPFVLALLMARRPCPPVCGSVGFSWCRLEFLP